MLSQRKKDQVYPSLKLRFHVFFSFYCRSMSAPNNNRLSSTSDSGSVGMMEAVTPTRSLVLNANKITDTDKAVIEEMRVCASELDEEYDFDEEDLDDDDDSVTGIRRRNTDSKYVSSGAKEAFCYVSRNFSVNSFCLQTFFSKNHEWIHEKRVYLFNKTFFFDRTVLFPFYLLSAKFIFGKLTYDLTSCIFSW